MIARHCERAIGELSLSLSIYIGGYFSKSDYSFDDVLFTMKSTPEDKHRGRRVSPCISFSCIIDDGTEILPGTLLFHIFTSIRFNLRLE